MNIVLIEPLGIEEKLLIEFKEKLNLLNHSFTYYNNKPKNKEDLINRIKDQDIVMLANYILDIDVLKTNKNIKYIAVAFQGLDHIPLDYCKENNIQVSNCSGYSTNAVSEQTIGLTLTLLRNLNESTNLTKKGKTSALFMNNSEINNKIVGIIGLGQIGLKTANLFKAFGAKVIYYSKTKKNVEFEYYELNELLKTSDIISLHIPLNNETMNFLNKDKLNLIKKDAILINTARGKVVDNNYLAYLLNNNLIRGAAIDVYDYEPPLKCDYPLLHAKNIILTPHTAYLTKEALLKRVNIEFNNVLNYLK